MSFSTKDMYPTARIMYNQIQCPVTMVRSLTEILFTINFGNWKKKVKRVKLKWSDLKFCTIKFFHFFEFFWKFFWNFFFIFQEKIRIETLCTSGVREKKRQLQSGHF